ncbi:MAG: prephenate/arogenate dehydrogenase family protein [Rhodovibrionaceae bacterium]|nr:prephenate/arogenate dehydrogenase family protein [Rhodovibrionaceae bacterium]
MSAAPASQRLFGRIAIIGTGLIGSSLARAVRHRGLAEEIAGCARSQETRDKVRELGLANSVHEDPAEAADGADLVMLATPVGAYEAIAKRISGVLKADSIVTDAGSVKQTVIRDIGPYVPEGVHFIPGHPIAGTEHSGPEAGFAELFQDRWCILTPPPGSDPAAIDRVADLWRACGSMVEVMEPRHHDKVLAVTSHLPHLIAYTIVATATDLEDSEQAEVVKFSAGGFRDFTRIAASDPVMWRDIFLNNREAVLEILQRFNEDLTALQRAIRWGEGEMLEETFRRTRTLRSGVIEARQAGSFDPREHTGGATPDPGSQAAAAPETAAPAPDNKGRRES